jgi:type IV secretory pathway VirB4 component
MVLQVQGVDYESLDSAGQEYAVKRLESALKAFGQGFHVYQYLFKANRPEIPFANYDDPIVEAAVEQRSRFFESKRDNLYQIEIFYVILLEGARSKRGIGTAIARLFSDRDNSRSSAAYSISTLGASPAGLKAPSSLTTKWSIRISKPSATTCE